MHVGLFCKSLFYWCLLVSFDVCWSLLMCVGLFCQSLFYWCLWVCCVDVCQSLFYWCLLVSFDFCWSLLNYANLFRGLFRGSFLTYVGFFCSTLLMQVRLFCKSLLMYVGVFLWSILYDSFHACRSLLTCVSYLRQRLWRKRHRPWRRNARQCLSRRQRRQVRLVNLDLKI